MFTPKALVRVGSAQRFKSKVASSQAREVRTGLGHGAQRPGAHSGLSSTCPQPPAPRESDQAQEDDYRLKIRKKQHVQHWLGLQQQIKKCVCVHDLKKNHI